MNRRNKRYRTKRTYKRRRIHCYSARELIPAAMIREAYQIRPQPAGVLVWLNPNILKG